LGAQVCEKMMLSSILEMLESLNTSGFVLSVEQRAALASSLTTLVQNEKMAGCKMWGRVVGTAKDYIIVQVVGEDRLTSRKSFYSMDCTTWAQLPEVHPVIAASAKLIQKRFTGNPSHEFTVSEPGPSKAEAPVDLPAEVKALQTIEEKEEGATITTIISEDKRLAAVVAAIDYECAVVPHGAYQKTPLGAIVPVANYSGLSSEEASKLSSYKHFRVPSNSVAPIDRAKLNKALDFWDSIEADVPNGCWSLTKESAGSSVLLKSWLWPGFVFYNKPGTGSYGGAYCGTGLRNSDLVFMLA